MKVNKKLEVVKQNCVDMVFLSATFVSAMAVLLFVLFYASVSLFSNIAIVSEVKGIPSLRTVYNPFPSYFGCASAA